MSTPVYYTLLALLGFGCMRSDPDSGTAPAPKIFSNSAQKAITPESRVHFVAAEQQLAEGRYIFAATQLDRGIVAFRIETGKMSGKPAIRANRAIDTLTQLRKTLRHGSAVDPIALHRAILSALETETNASTHLPKPAIDRVVPVNGN